MQMYLLAALFVGVLAASCGLADAEGWKQKEFIITMWCAPPATDEDMSVLARDSYTLMGVSCGGGGTQDPEDPVPMLDLARKHGIRSLIRHPLISPQSLDDREKAAQLDALIDRVRGHPALEGYYLCDEPSATTFPMWGKLASYLKERDPKSLAYINLFPTYANQQQLGVFLAEPPQGPVGIPDNYAGVGTNKDTIIFYNEHLRQYIEHVKPDLISYDHYHFMKAGDGQQYFLNLALIRQAGLKANVPFLNIIQSCNMEKPWRLPNKHELRWLAFTTLAYGGKGISWFLYWGPESYCGLYQDGKRMPIADEVAAINQDALAVGNELLRMESAAVYHTGVLPVGTEAVPSGCPVKTSKDDLVIGLFKENGAQNAFMITNCDYKNKLVAWLTLDFGKGKLMEFSPARRKWVYVRKIQPGSLLPVSLNQSDGKLFRVVR